MPSLILAATKIPEEWDKRIQQLTQETGLTRGAILRQAIGQYLGMEQVNPVASVNPVGLPEVIEKRLSEIEARLTGLTAIEARLDALEEIPRSKPEVPPPKPAKPPQPRAVGTGTKQHPIAMDDPDRPAICPSPDCRVEGRMQRMSAGKLRADGTRGKRYQCGACGKTTTIG